MSYKARRRLELEARAEKTEHLMIDPQGPVKVHAPDEPLPDRVPLRFDDRTVRDIRVSKLEANLEFYAARLDMSVPELQRLIAARRYTPQAPAKPVELRPPSWYVSDLFAGLGTLYF